MFHWKECYGTCPYLEEICSRHQIVDIFTGDLEFLGAIHVVDDFLESDPLSFWRHSVDSDCHFVFLTFFHFSVEHCQEIRTVRGENVAMTGKAPFSNYDRHIAKCARFLESSKRPELPNMPAAVLHFASHRKVIVANATHNHRSWNDYDCFFIERYPKNLHNTLITYVQVVCFYSKGRNNFLSWTW